MVKPLDAGAEALAVVEAADLVFDELVNGIADAVEASFVLVSVAVLAQAVLGVAADSNTLFVAVAVAVASFAAENSSTAVVVEACVA